MKLRSNTACVLAVASMSLIATACGQQTGAVSPLEDPVNIHVLNAQRAAGTDYSGLLARLCITPPGGGDAMSGVRRAGGANGLSEAVLNAGPLEPQKVPPRADWYQEPRKIFDNFYWIGIKRNSAWLIKTSEGLIVIDSLYHYAAEPSMVEGIRKLGFDPKDVKYIIISHAHGDHVEGAKTLQDLGAKVVMGAADWELLLKGPEIYGGKPKRDMEVTGDQKLTLGDTTINIYLTPGHTDGTLSYIFNVQDQGKPRVIAYSGGTAFNFPRSVERMEQYIATQRRLAQLAADAGATVVLSNHSEFDLAYMKARMLSSMGPGEENPFVVKDGPKRYFEVTNECAEAVKERLIQGTDIPSLDRVPAKK